MCREVVVMIMMPKVAAVVAATIAGGATAGSVAKQLLRWHPPQVVAATAETPFPASVYSLSDRVAIDFSSGAVSTTSGQTWSLPSAGSSLLTHPGVLGPVIFSPRPGVLRDLGPLVGSQHCRVPCPPPALPWYSCFTCFGSHNHTQISLDPAAVGGIRKETVVQATEIGGLPRPISDAGVSPHFPRRPSIGRDGAEVVAVSSGALVMTADLRWASNMNVTQSCPSGCPAKWGGLDGGAGTSVVSFASTDAGQSWHFGALLCDWQWWPRNFSDDQCNENSVAVLADGHTLMAVYRMGAGDGWKIIAALGGSTVGAGSNATCTEPCKVTVGQVYRYYYSSISTDLGSSWSIPRVMNEIGCARPRLLSLGKGKPLLLSGGRMRNANTSDALLWVSADGLGTEWTPHSLSYTHNSLTNASDHFSTGVNRSGIIPPFGEQFTETTAYTSLVSIAASSILVVYGKNAPGVRGGTTFAMQVDFKNEKEVDEDEEDEEDDDDTDYIQGLLDRCNATNGQALIPAGHYTVARPPICYSNSRFLPAKCAGGFVLTVPSNCHVRGAGRDQTTIQFSNGVNARFPAPNNASRPSGCGPCWRMFGIALKGSLPAPGAGNITISDLHLHGNTNRTRYAEIAGACEHGAGVFFATNEHYDVRTKATISGLRVQHLRVSAFAGDGLVFGDGVEGLTVSDIEVRDYLRCGIYIYSNRYTHGIEITGMRDIGCSPGVMCGDSIHFEACSNLTGVWIHDNHVNHSLVTGGTIGANVSNNVVVGAINGFDNDFVTVADNIIVSDGVQCLMLTEACPHTATIAHNTLISHGFDKSWQPVGVSVIGAAPYIPDPSPPYRVATNVTITDNTFVGVFSQPPPWQGRASTCVQHGRTDSHVIYLNGVVGAHVSGNAMPPRSGNNSVNTCVCCEHYSPHINFDRMCINITVKTDDLETSLRAVNDDTDYIQGLLDRCNATNGQALIPAGHYTVARPPICYSNSRFLPAKCAGGFVLTVPSNCHVRGAGRDQTTIQFSNGVNARFPAPNNASRPSGCGPCWRMFGVVPSPAVVNISISDLHLHGNTNRTRYAEIAGTCEHGAGVFVAVDDKADLLRNHTIRHVTVERLYVEFFAGDSLVFGNGVQHLLVSDIKQRNFLRVGVYMFSDYGARDFEITGVHDLPASETVHITGSSIHIEDAVNLTGVNIHDNNLNYSTGIELGGTVDGVVHHNRVHGWILGNGNRNITIRNNTVWARPIDQCGNVASPLISQGFVMSATITSNTLIVPLGNAIGLPVGIGIWGNLTDPYSKHGHPHYPASTDVEIASNIFKGNFSATSLNPRSPQFYPRSFVSPQKLVSEKAIDLNGVAHVRIRENHFPTWMGSGAANTCICCTTVDTDAMSRCQDVAFE